MPLAKQVVNLDLEDATLYLWTFRLIITSRYEIKTDLWADNRLLNYSIMSIVAVVVLVSLIVHNFDKIDVPD